METEGVRFPSNLRQTKRKRANLIAAVKVAFGDLLQSQNDEDSNVLTPGMYLTCQSDRWSGQSVEVLGSVDDGAILQLCKDSSDSKVI